MACLGTQVCCSSIRTSALYRLPALLRSASLAVAHAHAFCWSLSDGLVSVACVFARGGAQFALLRRELSRIGDVLPGIDIKVVQDEVVPVVLHLMWLFEHLHIRCVVM